MGSSQSTIAQSDNYESNSQNDYNPFNVPSITLNAPNEFNAGIAFSGCPPLHQWTGSDFVSLSTEKQAAYADGVVRGSYQKPWMIDQFGSIDESTLDQMNLSAVGALAYIYLKTGDTKCQNSLQRWCDKNRFNFNYIP